MRKQCKTEGCENQIDEKYTYCWDCMEEKKEKPAMIKQRKTKQTATARPSTKVEEHLNNINIGVWRLVNYKEAEMIKAGLDPKKVRDDLWDKNKKVESEDKLKCILP